MGALVVCMAFLTIGISVLEGGKSMCHRIVRWNEDRKLLKRYRRSYC